MKTVTRYKFSSSAKEVPPMEIEDGMQFVKSKYIKGCIFGQDNLLRSGTYKLAGWSYDLKPFLKRIIVNQYGNWQAYYAPNKTALRTVLGGTINEIHYLP